MMDANCEHFEAWFDMQASLSAAKLSELQTHVAVCEACALHYYATPRFLDQLAPKVDDARLDAVLVERVLVERAPAAKTSMSRTKQTLTSKLGSRSRVRVLLLAATILSAGIAGAALSTWQTHLRNSAVVPQDLATAISRADEPRSVPPGPSSSGPTLEPSVEPQVIQNQPEVVTSEAPKGTGAATESAAELFTQANHLRRQSQDQRAIQAYSKLLRYFPGSAEARQSRVILGWLYLDNARPKDALQQFDALAVSGELGEEALAGRAIALGRLGRVPEERAVWQQVLERFPESPHAARARKSLQTRSPGRRVEARDVTE
jgi:TolA-binding protein